MGTRLLAVDIDGTLLNSRSEVTNETIDTLVSMQKQGVRLALCSGRPLFLMNDLAEKLQMKEYHGYLIGANGNAVLDLYQDTAAYENILEFSLVQKLFDCVKSHAMITLVEGNQCNYIYMNRLMHVLLPVYRYLKRFGKSKGLIYDVMGYGFTPIHDLSNINHDINKVTVIHLSMFLSAIRKQVEKQYGAYVDVVRVSHRSLELISKHCDKVNGVQKVAGMMGITMNEVMTVGDGENDLTMIKEAGLGAAMGNALPIVKEAADIILPDNNHDGLAYAIRQYILRAES